MPANTTHLAGLQFWRQTKGQEAAGQPIRAARSALRHGSGAVNAARSHDARANEAAEPLARGGPRRCSAASAHFFEQRARRRGAWMPSMAAVRAGPRGRALTGAPRLGWRQRSGGRCRPRSRGCARRRHALHRALRRSS